VSKRYSQGWQHHQTFLWQVLQWLHITIVKAMLCKEIFCSKHCQNRIRWNNTHYQDKQNETWVKIVYKKVCFRVCVFNDPPFSAMTLLAGFIMAESAEMGRLMGLEESFMSIMTTCAVSPTFSRTQMNLSDSMVRVLNPMLAALMPTFWSWKKRHWNKQWLK